MQTVTLPLCIAVIVGAVNPFACRPTPDGTKAVAVRQDKVPSVVRAWNSALDAHKLGQLDQVRQTIVDYDRYEGHIPIGEGASIDLLDVYLHRKLRRDDIIQVYEYGKSRLAKVYMARRITWPFAGGKTGVQRRLWATLVRNEGGQWRIDLDRVDDRPFGLGAPVEGIQLKVRPRDEVIDSWDELAIKMCFANTNDKSTVTLQSTPTLYLQRNFALGISCENTKDEAHLFRAWYARVRKLSVPVVSGLHASAHKEHETVVLEPGGVHTHTVTFSSLLNLNRGKTVPEGPKGSFKLYVVYDPQLEWDPFKSAVPAWRHRIASESFKIMVGTRE